MFTRSSRLTCICALCAVACLVTTGARSSWCQQPSTAPMTGGSALATTAFDQVMFFPDTAADTGGGFLWWNGPGQWMFDNVSSLNLIANAYGLGMHQVVGLPGWAETDRYGLVGTIDREKLEAFKTLPMDEQAREQMLMTQTVLAERYQLKAHLETREMPVYELVLAYGGPKLSEKVLERHPGASNFRPGEWYHNYGTMEDLASKLARPVGGIVIDKTGLGTKTFFYELKWTSGSQNGIAGGDPSISTALEEQLGLKLVPATDRVEVLVIDHIGKPTPRFDRRPPSGSSL